MKDQKEKSWARRCHSWPKLSYDVYLAVDDKSEVEDTCGMEEEETIGAGTECGEAVGRREGVCGLAKDGGQESEIEGP